ncbi:Glycosyltransferase involved in cell wall bisynthesis [Formosa sp. Hel1_31_208]|uniref:glycosyltransferase family 2 protein n=1 Tax=Formosa sp. Hel1_31_208 TaxID=1798225 RepID=UPI000879B313|nr:glycosyltransferase family 2 protein [Formosa sp. Hel1_31_208]SDS68935.1 Glycosyltransferase involved in cell wall bisynthesis [Formosa sp. Hel1_31_208]
MKLSVIIPVFNGADFIQKSYNSIMHQNLDDFELLYVNNNSKDESVARIQELVNTDTRVKLLQQPKQGAAAARNMGIAHAKGDYVYIFDVDDEIYPNALNKMMAVLDQYEDRYAVFGKMVKSHRGISETQKPKDESDEVVLKDKPFWGLHWFSNLKDVVGPPAFLYRSTVFEKIGIYNEGIKNTEDTAFDIKLGMTCDIAFLDSYVYLYFKHALSTIEMAKKKENLTALHWTRFVKSHLPFYLENEVPLKYKSLLYTYLYQTTGKRIYETKGIGQRQLVLQEIKEDIAPVTFPILLRLLLGMLIIFPFSFLLKIYVYYLVPYYIKNHIKTL